LKSLEMTGKKFLNKVANNKEDILQIFLDILKKTKTAYCIVGGLAVNAYAEPIVSLDIDVVMENENIDTVSKEMQKKGLKVERLEHSVNLTSSKSGLSGFIWDVSFVTEKDGKYIRPFLPCLKSIARANRLLRENDIGLFFGDKGKPN